MAATDVERASHLGDGQRNETNTTDGRTNDSTTRGRETQTVVEEGVDRGLPAHLDMKTAPNSRKCHDFYSMDRLI